ncbi:unnamed protein product [Closterium sp. NIES-53]
MSSRSTKFAEVCETLRRRANFRLGGFGKVLLAERHHVVDGVYLAKLTTRFLPGTCAMCLAVKPSTCTYLVGAHICADRQHVTADSYLRLQIVTCDCSAGRPRAVQRWQFTLLQRWQAALLLRWQISPLLVAMVDPVVEAGVEDTLHAREAGVRACHEFGAYGEADLEILLLGTHAQWAREHSPPCAEADGASASPQLVHNEAAGRSTRLDRMDRTIEPHLEIAGLKKFVDGNVLVPDKEDVELWLDFCAAHLLTFMVISRDANMRGKSGGGGGWKSSNAKSTEGADHGKSAKGDDRGGGGSHREGRRFYICDAPDHLSYDCPGRDESDDDRDANRRKGDGGRRRPDNQPRKEKQASNTSSTKDAESSGGNARGEEAWCSMVGVVEMTISLALEVGEDSKAVAAAVHDNPSIVLLDSGCSHLRRHAAERRRAQRPWLQRGTSERRRQRHRCSARGGQEAGPCPRCTLHSGCAREPTVCWPA